MVEIISDFRRFFLIKILGIFILITIVMVAFASFVPRDFPVGTEIHVSQGASLTQVATLLTQKRLLISPFLFKVVVVVFFGHKSIIAGDYFLPKPQNLWTLAARFAKGDYEIVPVKVTIPEGSTVNDIAGILLAKMPNFDAPYFIKIAHDSEGYLFPDTYSFSPHATVDEIYATLRKTFDIKFQSLLLDITTSGRRPTDIIIMASILEKEANVSSDRAIIAGILWKRLDEGMKLQVDPTVAYGTSTSSLYNTYIYKGLPKGPISNPGLDALKAAIHPTKTPYYYYLSDSKGVTHYATTYEEHTANIKKYLK